MTVLSILASACPLILCSIGALFTEYAGVLALFLDGLISLSAFLTYTFSIMTGNPVFGLLISTIICTAIVFGFAILIEKFKAHCFIAGIALNLIFSSSISMLSFYIYGNRGVLASPDFSLNITQVRIWTVCITIICVLLAVLFTRKTRTGLYLRITGSDADVLKAKGVNPAIYRVLSWILAAFLASLGGSFLVFRISSFVPNISSGRGWMALAAVFIGKKKTWRVVISVLIFCIADIFAITIQNYIHLPAGLLLSFPYIIVLILIAAEKK